jgi:hypothetical protein
VRPVKLFFAPLLSFEPVTAPFFSSLVPTLSLPSSTAAKAVPPAMTKNRASEETTLA